MEPSEGCIRTRMHNLDNETSFHVSNEIQSPCSMLGSHSAQGVSCCSHPRRASVVRATSKEVCDAVTFLRLTGSDFPTTARAAWVSLVYQIMVWPLLWQLQALAALGPSQPAGQACFANSSTCVLDAGAFAKWTCSLSCFERASTSP